MKYLLSAQTNALALSTILLLTPNVVRVAAAQTEASSTAAARADAASPTPVAVAQLVMNPEDGYLPVLQLRLNGSEPMYFLFDTGTSDALALAPWVARKLNLSPLPGQQGRTLPQTQSVSAALPLRR